HRASSRPLGGLSFRRRAVTRDDEANPVPGSKRARVAPKPASIKAGGPTSMTVEFLNPTDVHAPGGYSHAVTVSGRLLIVAGQIGLDKDRNVVGGGDFEAQAAQAFDNLKAVLAAGGARMEDVV